jgi:hypothetical protein
MPCNSTIVLNGNAQASKATAQAGIVKDGLGSFTLSEDGTRILNARSYSLYFATTYLALSAPITRLDFA